MLLTLRPTIAAQNQNSPFLEVLQSRFFWLLSGWGCLRLGA